MSAPMMKCGHVAVGTCTKKASVVFDPPIPVCITCDCYEVDDAPPSTAGRRARCAYYGSRARGRGEVCKAERDSSPELAFFEYRGPDTKHYKGPAAFDEFYCGCWGWD